MSTAINPTTSMPAWKPPRRRLGRNGSMWLGILLVGLFMAAALAAPLLAPPDPNAEFSTYRGVGKINRWIPFEPRSGLPFGSLPDPANNRQLDIWYSLVWGTRSALRFGLLTVLIAGAFGVTLGGASAYLGGLTNTLLMGFTDAFLALPVVAGVIFFQQFIQLLLRSTGASVFLNGEIGFPGLPTPWQEFLMRLDPLLIAMIVFSWMPYARLVNTAVQQVRQEEYVQAARALGAGRLRLIFQHLIPNAISPAIVLAARDVGYLVLLQAGFTFIGLGQRSEWGVLLSLARSYIIGPSGNPLTYWWLYLPSTLVVVLFGVGWNMLGDGLNVWLSPHKS